MVCCVLLPQDKNWKLCFGYRFVSWRKRQFVLWQKHTEEENEGNRETRIAQLPSRLWWSRRARAQWSSGIINTQIKKVINILGKQEKLLKKFEDNFQNSDPERIEHLFQNGIVHAFQKISILKRWNCLWIILKTILSWWRVYVKTTHFFQSRRMKMVLLITAVFDFSSTARIVILFRCDNFSFAMRIFFCFVVRIFLYFAVKIILLWELFSWCENPFLVVRLFSCCENYVFVVTTFLLLWKFFSERHFLLLWEFFSPKQSFLVNQTKTL